MAGESSKASSALLSGVLFGALFPVAGTLLVMGIDGIPFSASAVLRIQATEPLLWLVDLAPLVLGAVGASIDRRRLELERLRAQVTAQEVDAEADRFLSVAIDPMAILDFEGRFRRISPGLTRVLGYTLDDLEEQTLMDLAHPEERSAVEEWLAGLSEGSSGPQQRRKRFRTRLGEYRWLDWSTMPIPERSLFYAQGRDITAEVEARAELVRAREAAEASSRAKSEFLANISHELRTPMNGIIGMTSLALESELSDEQKGFLEAVSQSASRLMGIIEDLLDFSQLETDRLAMVTERLDVAGLVDDVAVRMRERAQRKGLVLAVEVEEGLPTVVGAVARLSQVLGQLVDNAVKFTEQGRVTLRVRAADTTRTHATLAFEVEDTGIGFDASEKEHLFEAFAQADSSLTRQHGGTGLGLSVASRLVELMGGRMEADSAPGRGSTFRFALILPLAEPVEEPSSSKSETLFVLLVDDNRVNRVLTEALLTRRGYSVTVAGDGAEGVEFFAAATFDAVLMDVEMPGMDGLTATREMRRVERDRLHRTPIIALTALSARGDRETCLKAGMDEYLTMPADGDRLDTAIRTLVGASEDFERGRALGLAAGDTGAVAAAASELIVQGRDDLTALREAAGHRDGTAMARSAERLEALAEGLSMNRLRDIAHRVAVLSRQGRSAEAATLMAELDEAYRRGVEVVSRGIDVA